VPDIIADEQAREWELLYRAIRAVLQANGREDALGRGDYWLLDENWGAHRHKVEVQNLALLAPSVVIALKSLLNDYSDWEITLSVDRGDGKASMPAMGLIIRDNEIIDGLRRECLPEPCNQFAYPGSRPITEFDLGLRRF
jgi:hypothetical protein